MATQRKLGDFFGRKRKTTEEGKQDASAEIDSVIPDSEREVEPDDETTPNRPSCSSDTLDHSRDRSKTKKLKKQKHATAFDPEWKEGRPWLIYKPSESMYCEYCQEFNKIPFGRDKWNKTPCERLREESVKDHKVTASHRDAAGLHLQREASQFKNIGELLNKSKELSKDSMVKAFQCLYFLTKRNIPHTTNFEPLLDLLTDLGLDVKSKLCQGENAKYTSNTSIKEFLLALSDIVEMEILSELRKAKYYSLMFDETTDISTIEQMVIHARYVDENG